jgi:hypothetical protein
MTAHLLAALRITLEVITLRENSIRLQKPTRQGGIVTKVARRPESGPYRRKCRASRSTALSKVSSCLQKQNLAKCRGARAGSS